ncbi:MAG: hypothetical protein V4582_22710 [Pseudomonadota bacterium]
MNHPAGNLALRREALVAQCALQRMMVAAELRTLVQPVASTGWRRYLGGNLKIPLTIAGVVIGIVATRPSRALPLLQMGAAAWGIARKLLPLLRSAGPDSGE